MMSDGGRQMRLAKSNATVNKERVVFLARPLGDRQRRGVRELIARPDYEFGKRVAGVQLGVQWSLVGLICAGVRCPVCKGCRSRLGVNRAAVVPVRGLAPAPVFAHS